MLAAPPRPAEPSRIAPGPPPRLGYRPALDGIRALAVVAVFAYHAKLGWARAGFLGVDVFFVLSGYLITALLLTERRREGKINLLRFWGRRARRLLPAVLVLLAAMAVAIPLLAPEQAHRLRADLGAALTYVFNWRLIFAEQSYFQATGRPPVLQHLWSLAVEEQFYLLWPPILAFALRKRPYRKLTRWLLAAAVASTVLMAVLFVPWTDPSRVYYGTDTRAAALLIGAALACATTRWQLVDSLRAGSRRVLELAGLLGAVGLGWAISHVNEFDPRLYRGGFLAVAVLAAAVVAAAARPGRVGPVSAILGLPPLVWLGRRSYAVYLWFWPVMMFTRPHRDISLSGPPLVVVQAAITLVLAALSYRLVEKPIRHGALNRVWDDLRQRRRGAADGGGQPVRRATAAWGLAMAVTVGATAVGVAAVGVDSNRSTEVLASSPGAEQEAASRLTASIGGPRRVQLTLPVLPSTTVPPTTVVPPPVDPAAATPSTEATTTTTTAPAVLPTISAKVTAVGDSVLLGAKPLLESQVNGILVDATVGRQFAGVVSSIRAYKDAGQLGELVVVQTGNNGPIAPNQFEELMTVLRDVPKVLVVNVKVDRAWQNVNNEVMSSVVSRTPNAVLIDWHAIATAHPEAFYDDGLHLTAAGIRLFTGAVLAAVAPA